MRVLGRKCETYLTALAPGGLETAEETAPAPAGELGRGASALMPKGRGNSRGRKVTGLALVMGDARDPV